MKRLLLIAALMCAGSLTAFAGDIPTDGFTSEGSTTSSSENSPGEIPSVGLLDQQIVNTATDFVQLMIGVLV